MLRWLTRLFSLLMFGAFVLALRDAPVEHVLGLLGVGFLGWIASSFLDFLRTRHRFFTQVEAYARSQGLMYESQERMSDLWRSVAVVVIVMGAFILGIVLSITQHRFLYMAVILLFIFVFGISYGLKRLFRQQLSLSETAETLGLTYRVTDPMRTFTLEGEFRGRPVRVRLKRERVMGTSHPSTTSSPAGRVSRSGVSFRTEETTFLAVEIHAPPETRLLLTQGKRKSRPPALVQHLWQDPDLQDRLRSILPFVRITLDTPRVLTLFWKDAVTHPVEVRFLLDMLCDLAEGVESFFVTA